MLLLHTHFNAMSISLQALDSPCFSKEFIESSDDPNCSIQRDQSPGTYCFVIIFSAVSCRASTLRILTFCWAGPPHCYNLMINYNTQCSTLKLLLCMIFHLQVSLGWFLSKVYLGDSFYFSTLQGPDLRFFRVTDEKLKMGKLHSVVQLSSVLNHKHHIADQKTHKHHMH